MKGKTPTTLAQMVHISFGSRTRQERMEAIKKLQEIEQRLAGKSGEFALIYYRAEVPFKFTMTNTEYETRHFFRLGVLEGEKFVWAEVGHNDFSTITLPISRFLFNPRHPPHKANIFDQILPPAHPPVLGLHVAAMMPSVFRFGGGRTGHIDELLIGDEEVKKWIETHYMLSDLPKDYFNTAAKLLSKLILEPMGPNDGPMPDGTSGMLPKASAEA